jgi:hypothetical protein
MPALVVNYKSRQTFEATFYHLKSCVILVTKPGLGYIFGDFLTHSFGHPCLSRLGLDSYIALQALWRRMGRKIYAIPHRRNTFTFCYYLFCWCAEFIWKIA